MSVCSYVEFYPGLPVNINHFACVAIDIRGKGIGNGSIP